MGAWTAPFILALLSIAAVVADDRSYRQNAICVNDQLMRWYDRGSGLWPEEGSPLGIYWWQSANMLTAFNDFALLHPDVKSHYGYIWETTYNNAPSRKPNFVLVQGPEGRPVKAYRGMVGGPRRMTQFGDFNNKFYDDEAWWGLAWLGSFHVTGDQKYLREAITIWYDMKAGWGKHRCGGLPWNKAEGSWPVAISNELYIALGAALANSVGPDQKPIYLSGAIDAWNWFQASGMINSDNLVNDGLDPDTCRNDGRPTYSYNQGVILGALTELFRATGDASYLDVAGDIADAATRSGSPMLDANGILVDDCDRRHDCSGDGIQFKGVFSRNLKKLQRARSSEQWKRFLETNARSIWNKDLNVDSGCRVGVYWGGPYTAANPSSQSSGLDAVSAALAVTS